MSQHAQKQGPGRGLHEWSEAKLLVICVYEKLNDVKRVFSQMCQQ